MSDRHDTTEMERLQRRLDEMDCAHFHIELNRDGPVPTAEQVAADVNRALDAFERGDFVEITEDETDG